jgi:diguanylate cyclase (GGDEF)-like protein/PAS domain S-box-containing protein
MRHAGHSAPQATAVAVAPARRARWKQWLTAVLVLNVAIGMGLSVVLLHHQTDARRSLETQLAQADARAAAQTSLLWTAVATGQPSAVDQFAMDNRALSGLTAQLATSHAGPELQQVLAAQRSYERSADSAVQTFLAQGTAVGQTKAASEVTTAESALHRATTSAIASHQDASRRTGRIADTETVLMMVFAAVMAGVLFRKFDWARRTAHARAEQERARSEARFRALVFHSSDVISVTDADTTIRYQTPSITSVLGYDPHELIGTTLLRLVHPDDALAVLATHEEVLAGRHEGCALSARLRAKDGSCRHVEIVPTNLLDNPDVAGVVMTLRDVTERLRLQAQLSHNAFHDALTGLPNRALFRDRLSHALSRGDSTTAPLAVLFVDVDDFKAVNDDLGHAAGDELLVTIAARLRKAVRPGDTLARLGGDEFALLLEGADPATVSGVAQDVLAELGQPLPLYDREFNVHASIGVAQRCADDCDPDELVRCADIAMYVAKRKGKGRYEIFEPGMATDIVGRLQLRADLERALQQDEFVVYYQPIVDLGDGGVVGVEALVRWQHPERGLVSPVDFIPLAEETGLIVPIGGWVLRQACAQTQRWRSQHPDRPLKVSVNLSARQLEAPDLVGEVSRALRDSGLPASALTLEITESLLMVDLPAATAILAELRTLGVRLAIDDFGTGYSSLSYLEQLPIDVLKIDQSFVSRLGAAGEESVMVRTITQLAKALNMGIVAEGIELPEQVRELQELECPLGQGYLFARPASGTDITALLSGETPSSVVPDRVVTAPARPSIPRQTSAPRQEDQPIHDR